MAKNHLMGEKLWSPNCEGELCLIYIWLETVSVSCHLCHKRGDFLAQIWYKWQLLEFPHTFGHFTMFFFRFILNFYDVLRKNLIQPLWSINHFWLVIISSTLHRISARRTPEWMEIQFFSDSLPPNDLSSIFKRHTGREREREKDRERERENFPRRPVVSTNFLSFNFHFTRWVSGIVSRTTYWLVKKTNNKKGEAERVLCSQFVALC